MHIICLSSQSWNEDLWTNKQHIMSRLAKQGHQVLYVSNQVRSLPEYLFMHRRKSVPEYNFLGVVQEAKNLCVANSFHLPLSGLLSSYRHMSDFKWKLRLILPAFKRIEGRPVVWVYHPGYGAYLDDIPRPYTLVYDCVDDYPSFPQFQKRKAQAWIQQAEAALLARADVVFTSSLGLYESRKAASKNCHYVHNVGDYDHFHQVYQSHFKVPHDLQSMSHPRIGFYGALDPNKLDFDLIRQVAVAQPDWSFVMIGPTDLAPQLDLPNLYFLGKKRYDDLPTYLSAIDVLWIPYQVNVHTRHVFPIKYFEYLATGKPVVTTPLPALDAYTKVVKTGSDAATLIAHIQALLLGEDHGQLERMALAKDNSWDKKVARLMTHVGEVHYGDGR